MGLCSHQRNAPNSLPGRLIAAVADGVPAGGRLIDRTRLLADHLNAALLAGDDADGLTLLHQPGCSFCNCEWTLNVPCR